MANKNGHWYTDKNGNHYFVEEGQTPQEGWEASKRRKMINGGKYQVSEDGNEYRDVEKDEYDKFEADDASFDDNIDDDFGFDDEDDYDEEEEKVRYLDKTYNRYFDSQENWKRNETGNYEIGDDENYGYVLNDGERPGMIRAGRVRNGDHEHPEEEFFEDPQEAKEWVEEVANGDDEEYNREMQRAQEQNAMMSEGGDDDFNKGQTVDAPEKGEGWKKTKMASGTLYEGPNGERYMDDGSAPEKVKIGAKEMTKDEWKDWYHKLDDNNREMGKEFLLNHASEFDMSERDMERFLDGGSQGKYKYGKDSQNRFYVDDETGYRQYFTRESEARDYADRMNAAQGKDSDNPNNPEPEDEHTKKHREFLEKGKATWNQKLQKGDKVVIEDKDGNDIEAYIDGFWYQGNTQDEDTYEEGKDNNWHDFRAVKLVDKDGKYLGSVNAFQIKKHERPQPQSGQWSNDELDKAIDEHDLWNITPEFRDALLKRLSERLNGKK